MKTSLNKACCPRSLFVSLFTYHLGSELWFSYMQGKVIVELEHLNWKGCIGNNLLWQCLKMIRGWPFFSDRLILHLYLRAFKKHTKTWKNPLELKSFYLELSDESKYNRFVFIKIKKTAKWWFDSLNRDYYDSSHISKFFGQMAP